MKKGPWLLVALMAVVVAGLLVALVLQSGEDGPDVEAMLAAAPAAVDRAGSAQIAMTVALDTPAADVNVDGTGAVDFSSGAGWFTVEMAGRRIELRTDGTTLYVLPDGETTWLAARSEETEALGSFGTGPGEAIAFVDLLRGRGARVRDHGDQEIGGTRTRHLRADIDIAAAIERADASGRKALESLAALVPKGRRVPLDVWIDDDGLPVRQRLAGTLQGFDVVVTVDLTRFGSALGVPIPPEGMTRDIEPDELTRLFGQP